jgi:hypothetical protein
MKLIFIFVFLLSLAIGVVIVMDMLQGLGITEVIHSFIKIKQKLTPEEMSLIVLFFMPLIISKFNHFYKNHKEA